MKTYYDPETEREAIQCSGCQELWWNDWPNNDIVVIERIEHPRPTIRWACFYCFDLEHKDIEPYAGHSQMIG